MITIEHTEEKIIVTIYTDTARTQKMIRTLNFLDWIMSTAEYCDATQRRYFSFQDTIMLKQVRAMLYQDLVPKDCQTLITELAYLALNNHPFARLLLDAKYVPQSSLGEGSEPLAK